MILVPLSLKNSTGNSLFLVTLNTRRHIPTLNIIRVTEELNEIVFMSLGDMSIFRQGINEDKVHGGCIRLMDHKQKDRRLRSSGSLLHCLQRCSIVKSLRRCPEYHIESSLFRKAEANFSAKIIA